MKYARFYIYGFGVVCANSMVVMFLSLYLKSRGVEEVNIGGILGTYHAMLPLVVLGFGLLADRVSCKRLIVSGSLISTFYCMLMPQLDRVGYIVLAVCLGGIGLTLAFITVNVLFLKILPETSRGKPLSFFVASMTSGYAVGSAISSILVRSFDLSPVIIFYFAGCIHLVCFLVALRLPEARIERFPMIRYFHDMKQVPVFCLGLLSFSLGFHWGSESYGIVRFMDEHLSVRGLEMAALFLGTGIALAIFTRLAGHLVENHGGFVKFLVFGMILSGAMHSVTTWARNFPQFLIIRVIHTCGDGFIIFTVPMLVSLAFPSSRMGGNYGFNRTMNSIGSSLGGALSGYLVFRYFLGTPFLVTGIFQVLSAWVIWILRVHLPLPKQGASPVSPPASALQED